MVFPHFNTQAKVQISRSEQLHFGNSYAEWKF